jgi:Domain of unknown function (DUF4386)
MTVPEMRDRMAEAWPRFKARMAGVFQLLEALTATFPGLFVLGRLVVSGSGAATAANILGHERLFWLGFASSLIGVACHIAWALLMYELLKPVNRSVPLFAALVILVGCAIQALQIYLVFFGAWCLLIGYLIFRSTFLPRVLGVLVAISGLGWVTYLDPLLAHYLWRYIAAASALGEIPLEFGSS